MSVRTALFSTARAFYSDRRNIGMGCYCFDCLCVRIYFQRTIIQKYFLVKYNCRYSSIIGKRTLGTAMLSFFCIWASHLITEIRQTDNGDFKVIYLLAPIVPVHYNVQPEVLLLQSRCHSTLDLWHKNSRPQAARKGHG